MKAKMTVYQKGGKMPITPDPKKKGLMDHLKMDAAQISKTPSEVKNSKLQQKQEQQMKDYRAAGRIGADQSGIREAMNVTNKQQAAVAAQAAKERAAKDKFIESLTSKMPKKYSGGGTVKPQKNNFAIMKAKKKYENGGTIGPERKKVEKAVVKPKDNNSMTYQPKKINALSHYRGQHGVTEGVSLATGKDKMTGNASFKRNESYGPGEFATWLKNPENRHMYMKYREEVKSNEPTAKKYGFREDAGPNPYYLNRQLPKIEPVKPIKRKK